MNINTSKNIVDDLIKFQIFLLTTKDVKSEIKSAKFIYPWKDFLLGNSELIQKEKQYSYENLMCEEDSFAWNYNTIWYGRSYAKFKCLPVNLQEGEYIKQNALISKEVSYLSP